jgi:hypothetical protein
MPKPEEQEGKKQKQKLNNLEYYYSHEDREIRDV